MKIRALILLTIVALVTACNSNTDTSNSQKRIITTTNIIANSLKEIVGDEVEIITMMNSETDPHSYTPTPKDYQLLENATIIVSNGLHLEGKLHESIVQVSHNNKINHIMLSDGLDKANILYEDGVADPHIWFDVQQWSTCVTYTVHKLIELHPENKIIWETKLKKFTEKLTALAAKTKATYQT